MTDKQHTPARTSPISEESRKADDARREAVIEFLRFCGGIGPAVDMIVELARTIWSGIFSSTPIDSRDRCLLRLDRLPQLPPYGGAQSSALLQILTHPKTGFFIVNDCLSVPLRQLSRLDGLPRLLLSGIRPDSDLRYFTMRNVRRKHQISLSPATVRRFQIMAQTLEEQFDGTTNRHKSGQRPTCLLDELEAALRKAVTSKLLLADYVVSPEDAQRVISSFLESCWVAGYLVPSFGVGELRVLTTVIDPEYLLTQLFGLPTGITGLDDVFGGGGLILIDAPTPEQVVDTEAMPGRTVLIKGGYGNGKSILALQIAAEIARKGGVAYVLLFEQGVTEYRFTLESIRAIPEDGSVRVLYQEEEIKEALKNPSPNVGVIILRGGIQESYSQHLVALQEETELLHHYPLRLIVVDPVNSISRKGRTLVELRAEAVEVIATIKQSRSHLLLVAEESGEEDQQLFEENISDTVIRLSSEAMHGYNQRVFEITKSRYQREQRGRHTFAIQPGRGITIFPSSAAVSARLAARRIPNSFTRSSGVSLGVLGLDRTLRGSGECGIYSGDVIVTKGPEGSLKTQLGLLFLLAPNVNVKGNHGRSGRARSLVISTRESPESILHLISEGLRAYRNRGRFKTEDQVEVCSFPARYANAGVILQRIEGYLQRGLVKGTPFDRAVVDDVTYWDHAGPQVREDPVFGATLVQLFRRYGVTCFLICSNSEGGRSAPVQQACSDSADIVIQLDRYQYKGSHRTIGHVLKTRDMQHHREGFEITYSRDGLEVNPVSALLRFHPGGNVVEVPIRLFMHQESLAQNQYNRLIEEAISAVLSPTVKLEGQDRILLRKALELGRSSTVDEAQIIQLDEYQLPNFSGASNEEFVSFSDEMLNPESGDTVGKYWKAFIPRLAASCRRERESSFIAIPFYSNLSMLAHRADNPFPETTYDSWQSLADACSDWQSKNPGGLFFDFPRQTAENYNSLFLEILVSLCPLPNRATGACAFAAWLATEEALRAAQIFWTLGHRTYANREDSPDQDYPAVSKEALVWRHWYTTLNQMLEKLPLADRRRVKVRLLPQGRSVAGEWFLAVPAYSAAPEVALSIIRFITSPDAEMDRVQRGVGLPTRSSYFAPNQQPGTSSLVSPYFTMDPQELLKAIENSFRRSALGCYSRISPHLAYQLRRILEIPANDVGGATSAIAGILAELRDRFERFTDKDQDCSHCRVNFSGEAKKSVKRPDADDVR